MLEKLLNGIIVDLSKVEYIGNLENLDEQRLFEIIINEVPRMFKFIGQTEKATETYNFLIDRIKEIRTLLSFTGCDFLNLYFYINMQSIKIFPVETFKRIDRNEPAKVYKIPKEYFFTGWDNLHRVLIQFKINTVF